MNKEITMLLPEDIQAALNALPKAQLEKLEEIRLRAGMGAFVNCGGGEIRLTGGMVEPRTLEQILMRASDNSLHTAMSSIANGFITIPGGHRIGVCGTAAVSGGKVTALREISSLNIRVGREVTGIAESIADKLMRDKTFTGLLIASPPGCGKTTFLRDMIRCLSDQYSLRTGIADERFEITGAYQGCAQFALGEHTDFICGCDKAEGVFMLLRSMNPQVVAMDEVYSEQDYDALEKAAGCGVRLLATVHCPGLSDINRKPRLCKLVKDGSFSHVAEISATRGIRRYDLRKGVSGID